MKNKYLQIRISSELKKRVQDKVSKDPDQSMSGYIIELIKKDLKERKIMSYESLKTMVTGGECRHIAGKACDYILVEADGEETAYAEEMIPDDATEQETDWNEDRANRLVEEIMQQLESHRA